MKVLTSFMNWIDIVKFFSSHWLIDLTQYELKILESIFVETEIVLKMYLEIQTKCSNQINLGGRKQYLNDFYYLISRIFKKIHLSNVYGTWVRRNTSISRTK